MGRFSRAQKALILILLERMRSKRRFGVHPINQKRDELGGLDKLMPELRADEERFRMYFRMSTELLVKNSQRTPISPEHRLAVTLRFLATGETFRSLGTAYRMGFSTVQGIVVKTCKVLYTNLRDTYLQTPSTTEEWLRIAQDFEDRWNVPHALGCVDGKHVKITCPPNSGSRYYCYKEYFSIVLMAVCDANYRIIYMDSGSYGTAADGGIFETSDLKQAMDSNTQNVFGIMAQRWRVLLTTIGALPDNADNIVRAVCVLHNFLIDESPRGPSHPTADADNGDDENGPWRADAAQLRQPQMRRKFANRATQVAHDYRETLLEYFNGAGRVDWQDGMVDV